MKIIFFGNADFGSATLESLAASIDHEVMAVVTNKDKRAGRNKKLVSTPIKKIALDKNIPIFEVDNVNDDIFLSNIKSLKADVFIVIAYKIIPEKIYSMPRYGAINLHASLLPEYRGPAPIQRCLIDNRSRTGLSSFFINNFIDRGRLIYQEKIKVLPDDTFYDLWKKLSSKGPSFIKESLRLIEKKEVKLIEESLVPSYAPKIDKKELLIDWEESAEVIFHKIRAFSPIPCMYTNYSGKRIKIISANIANSNNSNLKPGEIMILNNKLLVGCKNSLIEILKLRPESKSILSVKEFINGFLNKKQNKIIFFD